MEYTSEKIQTSTTTKMNHVGIQMKYLIIKIVQKYWIPSPIIVQVQKCDKCVSLRVENKYHRLIQFCVP